MSKVVRRILFMILILMFLTCCTKSAEEKRPEEPLQIRLVFDEELKSLITPILARFQETPRILADGKTFSIEPVIMSGFSAAKALANGRLKSELWISPFPGMRNWVNGHLELLGPPQKNCEPLYYSPMTIVGLPTFDLANAQAVLMGSKPFPAEGPATLNLTAPNSSLSGLASLLTLVEIGRTKVHADSLDGVRDWLAKTLQHEREILESPAAVIRRLRGSSPEEQQFALLPKVQSQGAADLKYYDIPDQEVGLRMEVCTSDADWVTPAHTAAISSFRSFLQSPEIKVLLASSEPPPSNETSVFEDPKILEQSLALFPKVSRPLLALFIMDSSGSMEGNPIYSTQSALRDFVDNSPQGSVFALTTFATTPSPVRGPTEDRSQILEAIGATTPLGGSALFDGMREALTLLLSDDNRKFRKVVLVITDGDDKNSLTTADQLVGILHEYRRKTGFSLSIFALGTGSAAALTRIAEAANGDLVKSTALELPRKLAEKFSLRSRVSESEDPSISQ